MFLSLIFFANKIEQNLIFIYIIDKLNFGSSIIFLFLVGGLGYLFGVIHHILIWGFKYKDILGFDYRPLFETAEKKNLINFTSEKTDNFKVNKCLSQLGAHIISMKIWHERTESSKRIKSASTRYEGLYDIAHGAGTTFIGSIFAVVIWLILIISFKCLPNGWLSISLLFLFPIIIILLHIFNYYRMVKYCQTVFSMSLLDELREKPAIIHLIDKEEKIIKKNERYDKIITRFPAILIVLFIIWFFLFIGKCL